MATRKYDSPLRAQQARDTRNRILEGAARLTLFDVARITHAAVAKAAGVSERTVYRHFETASKLHDAFTAYQEKRFARDESKEFTLDELIPMYERWPQRLDRAMVDQFVREQTDPAFLTNSRRRRYARIERALGELLPDATAMQRRQLVLVFGALLSPEVFRRAKVLMKMNPEHVVPGPAWAMRVLIDALRKGETPWNRS